MAFDHDFYYSLEENNQSSGEKSCLSARLIFDLISVDMIVILLILITIFVASLIWIIRLKYKQVQKFSIRT